MGEVVYISEGVFVSGGVYLSGGKFEGGWVSVVGGELAVQL